MNNPRPAAQSLVTCLLRLYSHPNTSLQKRSIFSASLFFPYHSPLSQSFGGQSLSLDSFPEKLIYRFQNMGSSPVYALEHDGGHEYESGYASGTSSEADLPDIYFTKPHLAFLNRQLQNLEPQGTFTTILPKDSAA